MMSVLVLAGIGLIFSTVARMGLWFGFVLETALTTQGCLVPAEQRSHRAKGFAGPHPTHQPAGWGGTRSWEGTQPGQLTPADPRGMPHTL